MNLPVSTFSRPIIPGLRPFFAAALSFVAVCAFAPTAAPAADWPQFLGPNRDGTSSETGWNQDWSANEPEPVWKAEVGKGASGIAVANGRAFTLGNERDQDTVYCFDAETGKRIWDYSYSEELGPTYYEGGTTSTPTVDGDRVYVVSKGGKLHCFDAATGQVKWMKDYVKDFGGRKQTWGWAASPLVLGDRLIVDPGAPDGYLMALDKMTGDVIWKNGNAEPAYSSPFRYELESGQSGIVMFTKNSVAGFSDKDGAPQFSFPWTTEWDVNASNPIPYQDGFYVASGYGTGAGFIDVSSGQAQARYTNKEVELQFQNAIRIGDHLYAVSGGNKVKAELKCIDLKTGRPLWSERLGKLTGTLLLVDGKLIILTDTGELILANPSPESFQEIGRTQAIRPTVWAAPAFANGLIYVRNNNGQVVCLSVRNK